MGFAEKPLQVEGGGGGGIEPEVKKWVIAGIPLRSPLKPIFTKEAPNQKEIEEEENSWSTPTSKESRIPSRLACPPPPCRKKPKPKPKPKPPSGSSSSCEYCMGNSSSGVIREFFTPPHDFENLFTRRTCVHLRGPRS